MIRLIPGNRNRALNPSQKAIELVDKHGYDRARHWAWENLQQHVQGSQSHLYWGRVAKELGSVSNGKPKSKAERRKERAKRQQKKDAAPSL